MFAVTPLKGKYVHHWEYLEQLRRLPIENPSEDDMALLCPHLEREKAIEAFAEKGYIATPPLRIRDAARVISLREASHKQQQDLVNGIPVVTRTMDFPACLDTAFISHKPIHLPYAEEAKTFAEKMWPHLLTERGVKGSCLLFSLLDPSKLDEDNQPKTVAAVYVRLTRPYAEVLEQQHKPQSQLLDDAIAEMTTSELIGQEYSTERSLHRVYNCAICGSGLSLSFCTGCGRSFRDKNNRSGWDTPLPRQVCELLAKEHHQFQTDLSIARERELQEWERRKLARLRT